LPYGHDEQANSKTIPIERLPGLSKKQQKLMQINWIASIDAFVAAASTKEGRSGLCSLLSIRNSALNHLLHDARQALGEERFRELSIPRPGGPLGALHDRDQQRPSEGSNTEDGDT